MADKKISELSSASTPLAGTEVLPIVQSGTTVKVTAENLVKATQPNSLAKTVPYLNASKVPTSSTALQFDGADLGIGVTPTIPAQGISIEMDGGTCIYSRTQSNIPQTYISSNAIGTGYAAVYKSNGFAAQYVLQGFAGTHVWATAPSGTAGGAVTFTDRLSISNAGNVTVNTGNLVVGTAGKGISFTNGGFITSFRGQITAGGGTTTTMANLENANENRVFLITVRQSGGVSNTVTAQILTYGASAGTLRIAQDNTPGGALDMNVTASGLAIQLVLGAGFGSVVWDWVITRVG